ncbi:PfkB family carbohydrate kinase [Micromonospora sp. NPDC050200]|uniref:PfkB family carbohydrate kinase n=1 Tax=Micromonospora sp. NPDC050200 TaxID=3155664 RepID=UPI0033C1E784
MSFNSTCHPSRSPRCCTDGPHRSSSCNLVPHPDLDNALLQHLDVLVVNQHEAAAILHTTNNDPLTAAAELRQLGPRVVVVTTGAHGAAYADSHGSGTVPAPTVPVIDTTGAGDAFLGSLALDLAQHLPLPDAVTTAVHIGSVAVQHAGAQPASNQ